MEVDRSQGIVVISHNEIKGKMPAMTMPFRVRSIAELAGLTPGARIRFDAVQSGSRMLARNITIVGAAIDFPIPAPPNRLAVGAPVPDFSLVDQDGRTVRLSDSRGSVTAINFIYTRCPMPEVCPRLAASFAYVARKSKGGVRLLTITLDPLHDTQGILREYASRWNAPLDHWRFLTGPEAEIRRIGGLFGLVYWPEDGVITHTSSTAVVDRQGRLSALVEGSSYRAKQLLDLVEATR
jgi:protein SCO1